ncbi:MAG: hypothetical protein K2I94_00290 [Muribaculaceae bacterium]|nr:hypothetical protein [Muribaculaceae bacterium]
MDEYYHEEAPETGENSHDISRQIEEINENVNSLGHRLESLVESQMAQLERITEDLSFKASLPLYRLMIEYVDMLSDMLRRQDHLLDMGESLELRFNALFESVEELQRYMIEQLDNHQIEAFDDVADDPLVKTERQEVVERQVENNENEFLRYGEDVDTYYILSAPGYIYRSVTQNSEIGSPLEVVLRPEKVIKVVKGDNRF